MFWICNLNNLRQIPAQAKALREAANRVKQRPTERWQKHPCVREYYAPVELSREHRSATKAREHKCKSQGRHGKAIVASQNGASRYQRVKTKAKQSPKALVLPA